MNTLFEQLADTAWWLAALPLSLAPRELWQRMHPRLPLERASGPSGVLTMLLGFAIGVPGFFAFAASQASATNDWMLRQLAQPATANDAAVGLVPYGISVLTLFIYVFVTPLGLLSLYLVVTGTFRAVASVADDAHGDPLVSGAYWAATTIAGKRERARTRSAREQREGDERPDVLQTGDWAGLPGVDYVVLASRRKAEWTEGAIILTSTDWYKLGEPFDIQTPAGLRTAYPLTKMETVEVVRRGIQYELPRLLLTNKKPRSTKSSGV